MAVTQKKVKENLSTAEKEAEKLTKSEKTKTNNIRRKKANENDN